MPFCRKCGTELHEDDVYCGNCGHSVEKVVGHSEKKIKIVQNYSDASQAHIQSLNNKNTYDVSFRKNRKKQVLKTVILCIVVLIPISILVVFWLNNGYSLISQDHYTYKSELIHVFKSDDLNEFEEKNEYEYEYDNYDRVIFEKKFAVDDEDRNYIWCHKYEYDSYGNIKTITSCDLNGNPDGRGSIEYEYDDHNNRTKETNQPWTFDQWDTFENSNSLGLEYEINYENEYDDEGKLVKVIHSYYVEGEYINGWVTKNEYDSKRQLVKTIRYLSFEQSYNLNDTYVGYWNEYEYDANGNVIKDTVFRRVDDDFKGVDTTFQYDKNGNVTSKTEYGFDGIVKRTIEYEYFS